MCAYVDAAKVSSKHFRSSFLNIIHDKKDALTIKICDYYYIGCKKDHSRTDYRKADKMRPGIWYLILAFAYILISIWSLYFVCSMYFSVQKTIC